MKTNVTREVLHKGFMHIGQEKIAQEIRVILTSPEKIAEALIHFNGILQKKAWDLPTGILEVLGEPSVLKEELSVSDFFDKLDYSRPILDEGVSPIHGKYTHALQQYIISYHLGSSRMKEVFDLIRSGPVEACEFTEGRKWTLWDEFFDRPAPFEIPNNERHSCRDALAHGFRRDSSVPPCLDARSPEWLTTVIALAPNHNIDQIFKCVASDLQNRAENVHQNIFVTGLESDEYLIHFQPQNERSEIL